MRKNAKSFLAILLPAMFIAGAAQAQNGDGMSEDAAQYLDRALAEMQRLSMSRNDVDWPALRARVIERAGDARTPGDTHDAIRLAVELLGDGHSYLYAPAKGGEEADWGSEWVIASTSDDLASELVGDDIGYILVPSFGGEASWDLDQANGFAERLQAAIREIDSSAVRGWVVDLRFNSGGNMWPMLAGLTPFLGHGTIGSFTGTGETEVPWICAWGGAGTPRGKSAQVAAPYSLANPDVPVAVLTGKYCLSSGEAVVTAFRGRPNTRSFGSSTGGASTATQPIWLGDGAMIFITTAIFADRAGNRLGGRIPPDAVIEGGPKSASDRESAEEDPPLDAAVRWLREK